MRRARRALHRDRTGPARPRRVRQAAGRLLGRRLRQRHARPARRARHRARPPSSATRSAAAWPLSSPTSTPTRCERLVLVATGGVGPRGHPGRCAWRRAVRRAGPARRCSCPLVRLFGRVAVGSLQLQPAPTSAATPTSCSRVFDGPARRRGPDGVHPHAALGGRLAGPGRHHARPLLPGAPSADAARLGRTRRRHPRGPRGARRTRRCHGSRLEIFDDAGHFPHHSDPERFTALLVEFVASTDPAVHDPQVRRELLCSSGGQATPSDELVGEPPVALAG